ncbi:MAG: Cysteine desulfurase, partial [Candidatus Nomurabacteria bacterium GW2011_GWA2_40_9]
TATVLYARPEEVIFTSGGTEGNNLAIQGLVWSIHLTPALSLLRRGGNTSLPHIITTNIEHPSVLETCKMLEQRGLAEVTIVSVEANGIVDPKKIKKEIKENTVLVSVMYANNEIGTVQPIREIAKEIRHFRKNKKSNFPVFHTDAVQAVNYLNINVEQLGIDLMTLSGSKITDAGRVGILYKRKSVKLVPIYGGGDQELGIRPGTENLPEILKFAKALQATENIREKESVRLTKLRDYFFTKLEKMSKAGFDMNEAGIVVNGDRENRLPNNINITILKIPSDLLVIELSAYGVMSSSKSACKSSSEKGSYVITAIRPELDKEIGGVRFSLGRDTKKADIDYTLASLVKIINKLKKWYY